MTINIHQIKEYIRHFFLSRRRGHRVHSPFAYQLCEEVFYNKNSFYDFVELRLIRKKLLKDQSAITVEDHGAGSRTFSGTERKISAIAARGISPERQSEMLYKLVNLLRPDTIIELGTSLGLNTLYLAKANRQARVYTIEGSRALSERAQKLAENAKAANCIFIRGKFDEELPPLLNKTETIDFLYADGNHTYEATLRYFKMVLPKCGNHTVLVFDDIYWSAGMTRAWKEIINDPAITLSIDAFHTGFVFFRKEVKEKVTMKLWV